MNTSNRVILNKLLRCKMDWQNDLKLENDEKLFDIFSDTDRINIEPYIYAGNLLFVRGYDLIKLSSAKKKVV